MPDDILLNKAAIIERCIQRIKEELAACPDLNNVTHVDALILNIERACQAAIDMAVHMVSQKHLGIPKTRAEAFELIHRAGITDASLTQSLKGMVGFRNIAVHEYQNLDLEIIRYIGSIAYKDFIRFCDALGIRISG